MTVTSALPIFFFNELFAEVPTVVPIVADQTAEDTQSVIALIPPFFTRGFPHCSEKHLERWRHLRQTRHDDFHGHISSVCDESTAYHACLPRGQVGLAEVGIHGTTGDGQVAVALGAHDKFLDADHQGAVFGNTNGQGTLEQLAHPLAVKRNQSSGSFTATAQRYEFDTGLAQRIHPH